MVAQQAVLLLPALALACLGWLRRWVADDAFIDLRIVRNVVDGYGPVFNVGERVEAYTSPLWVAALAVGSELTRTLERALPLEWLAVGLGLSCAVAGIAAATWASRRASRLGGASSGAGLALPLGALVIASIPAFWDFATSGLETGLIVAWIGVSYWSVARLASGPVRGWPSLAPAAVLIGLGVLVRPDLALISAGFLGILLVLLPARRWRTIVGLSCAALLVPVAYEVFRMGYFAALVPNTALAKEAASVRWNQGWRYLADFFGAYWLWVPLLPLGLWWAARLVQQTRRHKWRSVALGGLPAAGGVAHGLFVVRLGGDFMHGRMLLPTLFTMLLPVMAIAGARWWHALLPACVVLPWALIAALWLHPPYHDVGNGVGPEGIADERRFYVQLAEKERPVTVGDYARADWKRDGDALRALSGAGDRILLLDEGRVQPGEAVAPTRRPALAAWAPQRVVADRKNIGMLGYAAGAEVRVIDQLGLADALAARLRLQARGRPGHEKSLPEAWVLAQYAAPESLPPGLPGVAEARQALDCGDLAALLDAIRQPLTVRRFSQNVVLAWRLTLLRISPDPAQAQIELCR
jgi:arabinofuranosyltransferase